MKRIFLIFNLIIFLSYHTSAQEGYPDITFNFEGNVYKGFGENLQNSKTIVLKDNKILTLCYNHSKYFMVRFLSNGRLDNSFGEKGTVQGKFLVSNIDLFVKDDGNILVVGNYKDGLGMVQHKADGSLDNQFGTDGLKFLERKVLTTATHFGVKNIIIEPDENILIMGEACIFASEPSCGGLLFRIDKDFSKVLNFLSFEMPYYTRSGLWLQKDGKIILYNTKEPPYPLYQQLRRFNHDFTRDNSFIYGGTINNLGILNNILFEDDLKIMLIGVENKGGQNNLLIQKLNSDGSLDLSFANNGKSEINLINGELRLAVKHADGKIVLSGRRGQNCLLARVLPNGNIDSSFGNNGFTLHDKSVLYNYGSLVLTSDDKIVTSGVILSGTSYDLEVARFNYGLNSGMVETVASKNEAVLYPNPVTNESVLEYNFDEEVNAVNLYDCQGKLLQSFIENNRKTNGQFRMKLHFSDNIKMGLYYLVISTDNKRSTLKVQKL